MSNGNILQIMTHDFVQLFQLKLCEVLQKIFIVDLEILKCYAFHASVWVKMFYLYLKGTSTNLKIHIFCNTLPCTENFIKILKDDTGKILKLGR